MPRLRFALNEPDEVNVVELDAEIAPIARVTAWAVAAPAAVGHRPITTPGEPECGPVRDMDGFAVHRVRVVSPEEMTCMICGETTLGTKCPTCGKGFDDAATPMVPTISYLNPDEYELLRRTW